jgi:hypothetical protein
MLYVMYKPKKLDKFALMNAYDLKNAVEDERGRASSSYRAHGAWIYSAPAPMNVGRSAYFSRPHD